MTHDEAYSYLQRLVFSGELRLQFSLDRYSSLFVCQLAEQCFYAKSQRPVRIHISEPAEHAPHADPHSLIWQATN